MSSRVTQVSSREELEAALGPAEPSGRALILVGGADSMPVEDQLRVEALFGRLVDHVEETGTALVDGGTDSGVMRLIGLLREQRQASFRLVGVLPRGALARLTREGSRISIAPGHPEILLVPGRTFGDEMDWLFGAADHLGGGAATTLVINGGKLTLEESHRRLAEGNVVVTVQGSGRAADELAADEGLRASSKLRVIPLTVDAAALAAALEEESVG
jgi:hypothetical protein